VPLSSATAVGRAGTGGYWSLLRDNPDFRRLWLGQVVSLLGDWFNLIASAALVAELTESGLALGGIFVVRMLAPFLVSPIAGVVADRYDRRRILIATDLARAVVVLGFLLVRDPSAVWLLYVLTALQLGISGFFFPTRTAILPDLVSGPELGAANAISAATWSTMLTVGAAAGGLVAGTWGAHPAFVVDALTFLLSAWFIWRIAARPLVAAGNEDRSVRAALVEYVNGWRYLVGHAHVFATVLHKPARALITFPGIQIVQVAIAEQVFVLGAGGGVGLGVMFGVYGAGTALGPIAVRAIIGDRRRALGRAIVAGYLLSGLGLAVMAPLGGFAAVLVGSFVSGVGGGLVWVFSTQLLLEAVPGTVRGRVFATEFALLSLMSAVGAAATGMALGPLGIQGVLWVMGALLLVPAALWVGWIRSRGEP